jgi:sugar/nucleoside kinase (ribokinase family)
MKICSIGGITEDTFLWHRALQTQNATTQATSCLSIPFGEKIDIEQQLSFLGGGAANTALNFHNLDLNASLVAARGNDATGMFLEQQLQRFGLSTNHILIDPSEQSGHSYILHNQCHDRIIFVYRGANKTIKKEQFPFEHCLNQEALYLTSMHQENHIFTTIIEEAYKKNIFIAINPGSTQLSSGAQELCDALHAVSIIILNRSEACTLLKALHTQKSQITQELCSFESTRGSLLSESLNCAQTFFTLEHYFQCMLSLGPQIAILTDGENGVYLATKEKAFYHQALPTQVIETVGAGDAFGSTFVALYLENKNIIQALRAGMVQSSSVIQQIGAQAGLLKKSELLKKSREIPAALLTEIDWHFKEK